MKIKPYIKYLMYVLEHKRNVFKVCWKRKMYKHAFTHDLSKFSKEEFKPYAQYFYISKEKYSDVFDNAWEHHYKNNPHHWQYWIDENGEAKKITPEYLWQMICDWEAMAIKFKDSAQAYYLNNYHKINLEYHTRVRLEYLLGINPSLEHNFSGTLKEFVCTFTKRLYNKRFGNFIIDQYKIDSYELLK